MTDEFLYLHTGETLKRIGLSSLGSFGVLRARAMRVALWLLLCILGVCVGQEEEECLLGIVGQPVSLPCFYPHFNQSTFGNLSIQWRRGDEVVLRSHWKEDGNLEEWSVNRATISADARLNGNISLELPAVDPTEHGLNYSLFIVSDEEASAALCTVCLSIAAAFSFPSVKRAEATAADGAEVLFWCQSSGGFPEPAVYWLINNTEEPPKDAVSTVVAPLPASGLFNITSQLRANISKEDTVSCTIENLSMNQNLTASISLVPTKPVKRRASEAMWVFSTALCVVIGLMVMAGIIYQVHLDRVSKLKKKEFQRQTSNRGCKRRSLDKEELEVIKVESDI